MPYLNKMKKEFFLIFALVAILPLVSAEIHVSKTPIIDVIGKEVTTTASYNFTITNTNPAEETLTLYSLLDMEISPETLKIPGNTAVNTKLEFYLGEQLRRKEGTYYFTYYLKGKVNPEVKDTVPATIISLYDALKATLPAKITQDDKTLNLTLQNKENLYIPEAKLNVTSAIFNSAQDVEIKPNSTLQITIDLTDRIRSFEAGPYSVDIVLIVQGEEAWKVTDSIALESVIKITSKEAQKGWFLYPVLQIERKNDGNTQATANIRVEKDAFSKLFTKTSIEPSSIKEVKGKFLYEWQRDLKPGETFTVEIKTNYLLPVLVLALIAAAAIFLWMSTTKPVVLTKRITKIATKGGEFALKVNLFLKSFIDIKNAKIMDLAPLAMPNIPPKFGPISPTSVKGRRIEWHVDRMYRGEERIFSYIIYSKLPLIGEITLPKAVAIYQDMLDRSKQTYSNQVFFLAEEKRAE